MPAATTAHLRDHLVNDVLGWWLRESPDQVHGGVFTCWDNRGTRLVSTDKYTWSQGRWMWLLAAVADALRRGVLPRTRELSADRCLELARATGRFLRSSALLPDGSTAFVTTRAGTPYEPSPGAGLSTSIFADCFVALGFARLARVDADEELAALAEHILRSASERIEAETAGTAPYPVHPAFASFGVPMILLGTATEIHHVTGSGFSARVAADAAAALVGPFRRGVDLVEQRPRREGFADTLLAGHRTPGHVLECLWFLVHALDTVAEVRRAIDHEPARVSAWLPTAARHALEIGWDGRDEGLFRYVDQAGGKPEGRLLGDPYEQLVLETWDTKLWWPHAEALYTTALLARRYGDEALARWHERLRAYTFAVFPSQPGQEWIQIRDRSGAPLDRTVALPVKDPFHIARALLLLIDLQHTVPGLVAGP